MSELAAQGKKGSEEWNNLSKSIREDSLAVAENTAKMNEVAKRFDLATMSVSQLRKRLNELNRQFNETSKATNSQLYAELKNFLVKIFWQNFGFSDKRCIFAFIFGDDL